MVETYSASLHDTNAAMPAFTPPPRFGDGSTGGSSHAVGGASPPATVGSQPAAGKQMAEGSRVTAGNQVGGHDSGNAPPASTPAQSVSYPPEIPGSGGVVTGGSGGQLTEPSLLPAAAAVIGGAGSGERETGAGVRFGPRGSSGLGAWSPAPNPASNPLGRGGISSTGTGEAGRGAGSGFAPMAGTGRGEEDREHRRPSYLIETEDIWGDGRRVAPPVIGEDPPDYHY